MGIPEIRRPADRSVVGSRAAVALRALRPGVRRQRSAEAAGVQRGHADVAARSGGGAVVLAAGRASRSGDQFNSIHERLIALWKDLAQYLPGRRIDFCSMDDAEDGMTVTYLQDTAQQAGLETSIFPIDEIGWDGERLRGSGRPAAGRGLQTLPVGVDGAGRVRQASGRVGREVDRAGVEDAAVE